MKQFLQFTQWYQPFLRKGDSELTQWADRQNSIPITTIKNICADSDDAACSLIWTHSDDRPLRAKESVEELTRRINGD